ncbi:MAG: dihydroorotase, partial [Sneathiella sp.]
PKFFLGTDSAPHTAEAKEAACGCAGLFNAPYALESYATTFEEEGALDKLQAFASENGPNFYGLPLNDGMVVLERTDHQTPKTIPGPGTDIIPYLGGETLRWRFVEDA